MSLFYLEGASGRTIKMYRGALPNVDKMTITSARIADLPTDRAETIPHTLVLEKRLVLEFDATKQSVSEQYFYLGRHEGRYFLTLPSGG